MSSIHTGAEPTSFSQRPASRALRIALLTSAPTWRGSAVSFINLARVLRLHGHAPILLAGADCVAAGFAAEGFPAETVQSENTGFRSSRHLSRALRAARTEVLLCDTPRDLRVGALASLATPVTLINRYNCSRNSPPQDLGTRLAYERVRLTIFLTRQQASRVTAEAPFMAGPPSMVIPEGIDLSRFCSDRAGAQAFRRCLDLGNSPFLLAVGALSPEKAYPWLLRALALLGPAAPPLVVCGEGSLRDGLIEEARRLNVDARFAGFIPQNRLVGAYCAATCLLHACPVETFGLSVVEAMACGLPLVGRTEGALPEVTGDTAVLISHGDAVAYAAALHALLNDPARREAQATRAQARARTLYALDTMGQRYAEAIEGAARSGD